jgi:hypothetical protein
LQEVVSFFAPPPPLPEPPEQPPRHPWTGPPENELGEATPLRAVLVKRADLAIALVELVAYSRGIGGRFIIRRRDGEPRDGFSHPMHLMMRRGLAGATELPPELLRFGVEFSDGRRATTIERFRGPREQPPEIVLMQRGGGGGGGSWEFGFWIWPLPPAGPLTFAVEWPAEGVELTTCEVDAAPILEAAARSEQLWEESTGGSGRGVQQQFSTMSARQPPRPGISG